MEKTRLVWIDWMKTLAMFLIIAVHCTVPGNQFIYVFCVPAFLIISGFLSKKEPNFSSFAKKIWWNLALPMILLFLIGMVLRFINQYFAGSFRLEYVFKSPVLALLGMQGEDHAAGGLYALWFVYTLICCKILLQFSPMDCLWYWIILNLGLLLLAWVVNHMGITIYNAIVDTLLAMPFFIFGYLLKPYREFLNTSSFKFLIITLVLGGAIVYFCGTHNDVVQLYRCSYGSNLFLCLLGGIAGTAALFSLSRLLNSSLSGFTRLIGEGSIVILGLHVLIIQFIHHYYSIHGYWLYLESFLILLLFIPIILFFKHCFPIIVGKNRIKK